MIEKMFYKQREEFEVSAAKRDQELEFPEAVIERISGAVRMTAMPIAWICSVLQDGSRRCCL